MTFVTPFNIPLCSNVISPVKGCQRALHGATYLQSTASPDLNMPCGEEDTGGLYSYLSKCHTHFYQQHQHHCSAGHDVSSSTFGISSHLVVSNAAIEHSRLFEFTSHLQAIGETTLAAAIVIAMIQAAVALYQYRSNPSGELVFPPGLTCGIEYPEKEESTKENSRTKIKDLQEKDNKLTSNNPFQQFKSFSEDTDRLLRERNAGKTPSGYARTLFKINRLTVLLFPWIAKQINIILIRNSHLFHIFFILSLASAFDIWRPDRHIKDREGELSVVENILQKRRVEQKLVVIGDSLAVGIGCVEMFDENKNTTLPMLRVEKLARENKMHVPFNGDEDYSETSPVFPKVFAQTLAKRLKQPVVWRSAGVDGGDVDDIRHFCAGVIAEEAKKGHPPDVVVIICGVNDLKKAVANPFKTKSARAFRSSLDHLISEIRTFAPNASIVLPALPVQMFHKNSIVNIFPLSLFLDTIVGFWDSQKKLVADRSPSNVMYLGLTAREIFNWYDREISDSPEESTNILIAPDGVHPNRRCYSKWARSMGNKFSELILARANNKSLQ